MGRRLEDTILKKINRFACMRSWGLSPPLHLCKQNEKKKKKEEKEEEDGGEEEETEKPL